MKVIDEIRHIHDLLSEHKDKWYVDFSGADECPELQAIVEKAKQYATDKITTLSVNKLYGRYKTWSKDGDSDNYYQDFLDDLIWRLGREGLDPPEQLLYNESINLNIRFL